MRYKDIRKECEELWAKNKYYVLSKSHKAYLEIRAYLREKEPDVLWVNKKIQEARDMKESKKDFSNAVLHVWGYFKKNASTIEKQVLFDILNEYPTLQYVKVVSDTNIFITITSTISNLSISII